MNLGNLQKFGKEASDRVTQATKGKAAGLTEQAVRAAVDNASTNNEQRSPVTSEL